MANLTEANSFDANVYQLATTDAVLGGAGGMANNQPQSLTNRTRWLYNQITSILATIATLAGINSPTFTGSPQAPTPATGDNSTAIATTSFAGNSQKTAVVNVAGNSSVVLTAAQYGLGIINLSGIITGNISVVFPATGAWIVENSTTGAFTTTLKVAGTPGFPTARGTSCFVYADGTNLNRAVSDLTGGAITTTPTPGDSTNLIPTTAFVSGAISALSLGTASTHASGDFDVNGAAAAVQTASFKISNNLSEIAASPSAARTSLGLGTAAQHPAADFDAAGAAASARVTAEAYTDTAVATLQVGKGVNATPTTGTGTFQRLIRLTVTVPPGGTVLSIIAFVAQVFSGGGSNSNLKITVGGTDYTPVPYLATAAEPVALSMAYVFLPGSQAGPLNVDLNWQGGVNVSSGNAFLTCIGAA